ncbi:MAG: prepilin peptidase [Verrucomicrobia bacterium]|nr:prepilin peptidase [Verrucomicrobiota bacterium]MCF7708241.1 prepilin peptidase [Verrucomicrobiota bacterium]
MYLILATIQEGPAALPFHFWSVVFFVLGTMVGSFLNVCIHRLPLGESIINPPSHCPKCKTRIPIYLNVPMVSWLWLRGKCRYCGARISPRYFIIELLTGTAFLASWLRFGGESMALACVICLFISGLIVASAIDIEHYIIPDAITIGGIAVGFVCAFFVPILHEGLQEPAPALRLSFLGAAAGAGIVYAILRLGKLIFGRQKLELPSESRIIFGETEIILPDEVVPYDELFYRKSDTIHLSARNVFLGSPNPRVPALRRRRGGKQRPHKPSTLATQSGRRHRILKRVRAPQRGTPPLAQHPAAERWSRRDVDVALRPDKLIIGDETFDPETVRRMEVTTNKMIIPREAMGLGDVKFMGAIGAFLGWKGALFSLTLSAFIGSAVGISLIALGKREWSSRIPYGPYIALAAVIWIFLAGTNDEAVMQFLTFLPQ